MRGEGRTNNNAIGGVAIYGNTMLVSVGHITLQAISNNLEGIMSRRENESNAITLLLLIVLLFLVLVAGASVFFWLQSLRAMEMRNQAERAELRARAEAVKAQEAIEEIRLSSEETARP